MWCLAQNSTRIKVQLYAADNFKIYPATNWCPIFNETISTFNTSENINQFQSNIDTIQEMPENLFTDMQVNVINCPNCPTVPNLASKTFYHKIRLDIYNLEIKSK
ncbi:unnamed protein product [Trichobilharzia regenti]|nr:unnamed protein product [Trichobilharzia regenti]